MVKPSIPSEFVVSAMSKQLLSTSLSRYNFSNEFLQKCFSNWEVSKSRGHCIVESYVRDHTKARNWFSLVEHSSCSHGWQWLLPTITNFVPLSYVLFIFGTPSIPHLGCDYNWASPHRDCCGQCLKKQYKYGDDQVVVSVKVLKRDTEGHQNWQAPKDNLFYWSEKPHLRWVATDVSICIELQGDLQILVGSNTAIYFVELHNSRNWWLGWKNKWSATLLKPCSLKENPANSLPSKMITCMAQKKASVQKQRRA